MKKLHLELKITPEKTEIYKKILATLKELKLEELIPHDGIGVRVYVNCNELKGEKPWFQDDDMSYMEMVNENTFELKTEISHYEKFQYRYIIIFDVPLFKKIGLTYHHLYSMINVSQLEKPMPTYFGNRVLPGDYDGEKYCDEFNVPSISSNKGACIYPFRSLIAGFDGKTTVCCVDDYFKLNLGDMNEGFEKIWNGEILRKLRIAHLLGRFQDTPRNEEKIPICLLCQEWFTPRLSPSELDEFAYDKELYSYKEKYLNRINHDDPELLSPINPYITFEISSNCNLKCIYCSQKNPLMEKRGDMDYEKFSNFVEDLVSMDCKFENINLFFRGESLVHKEFSKFVKKIMEINERREIFKFMVLHTNALLFNKENMEVLLDGFSQKSLPYCGNMVVSIDASKNSTYKRIRGGDLSVAKEKIIEFLKLRKSKNQFGPNLIIQFIILEENMEEAEEFLKDWESILKEHSHKEYRICATLSNQPQIIDSDIIYLRVETSPAYGDPALIAKISQDRYKTVIGKLQLELE